MPGTEGAQLVSRHQPVRQRAATLVVASKTLVAQLAVAGEDPASVGTEPTPS